MFNKKELDTIQEQLAAIQLRLQNIEDDVKGQREKQEEFTQEVIGNQVRIKDELTDIKSASDSAIKEFCSHVEDIEQTKVKFDKALSTFSLLQRKLEDTLFQKLNKAMSEEMRKLYTQTKSYVEIKKDVERAIMTMSKINQSVVELDEISKAIGSADVNLSQFMDKVNYEDRHKVQLLRENETLKKLVSNMRKKQ
jgi:hypothetical protein